MKAGEVRAFLGAHGLAPRRDLGQNFLCDERIAEKLARIAAVESGDGVIEIGTGLGDFKGKVWRIGLMGYASRANNVLLFLSALEQLLAEQGYQFIVDDFDDLLAGSNTGQDFLADSLLGDRTNKFFYNLKVDISFQQGRAHFTHGFLNIIFSQLAVTAQLFEYTVKTIC